MKTDKSFLEIQPEECRMPLYPQDHLINLSETTIRVLYFDPTDIYNRINHLLDPYKRHQSLSIIDMFPQISDGLKCACGCGRILKGRRWRWASEECNNFSVKIYWIIVGEMSTISFFTTTYHGDNCVKCNGESGSHKIEIDHLVGVKHGGGGSWLSNYQPLCSICHREKTNTDFGWKKESQQYKLQLQ